MYGMFFRRMAKAIKGTEVIDAAAFGAMLEGARDGIATVSEARVGDKTLMDTLVPACDAYRGALDEGVSFGDALDVMKAAAEKGKDSTRDMVAQLGRSSRLGERSRGVVDAGAASCCLILSSMADTVKTLIGEEVAA